MILCEHFIYALFNVGAYRLIKSPDAEKLLSEENFSRLCHLTDKIQKPEEQAQWFPDENVLAISFLRPTTDEYGRKGGWNHTILIKVVDYCVLTDPVALFRRHFIREFGNPPEMLQPLQVGK